MKSARTLTLLALLGAAGCTGDDDPDTPTDPVDPTLVERVVEALGGEAALLELDVLRIDATGDRRIDYEGMDPTEIVDASAYSSVFWHRLGDDAMRVDSSRTPLFEAFQFFPVEDYSIVVNGEVGGLTAQTGFFPPGPMPSQHVGALKRQQDLFNPHFLLQDVLDGTLAAAEGDTAEFEGRPHDVLVLGSGSSEIRLFVDTDDARIAKLETMENNPLLRDVPVEVHFSDWQASGALSFPRVVQLYAAAGLVHDETRVAIEVDPADVPADTFVLPPDSAGPVDTQALQWGHDNHQVVEGFFQMLFGTSEQAPIARSELAPGIELLASGHNSVAVRHDGGVVLLEGPNSPAQGDAIVAMVADAYPGEPITHVIQSHHHQDHSAGLRSIAAAGATVVAGHGAGAFMEAVLAAPSTLRPDTLSGASVATSVEEIAEDGTFVVADAAVTVTAYHVPANPHAEDMVVTLVESGGQRWVYEADLYNAGAGFTVVVGGPESFFATLRDLALIDATCTPPMPLTIVPAHGIPLAVADAITELDSLGVDVGCTP